MHVWKVLFCLYIAVVAVRASCDWNKWHEDLQNITSMAQTMLDIAQAHRSVHEVIKLCSEKIRDGGLEDRADDVWNECGEKYFDIFTDDMKPLDELCEAECQGARFLRECIKSETVQTFVSDAENACRNYQDTLRCMGPMDLKDCPIRDRLFLAALGEDSRQALYTAGCVDRPVIPTVAAAESTSSSTLQLPPTTTSTETAPSETTASRLASSTWGSTPRDNEAIQTTTGSDLSSSSTTSAGRVCALQAALACVKQKQTQVDAAASSTTDIDENLVAMCLAMGSEPDPVARCFHDNIEGCAEKGDFHLKAINQMWNSAVSNANILCEHRCEGYQQAFGCIKSLRDEPVSQLCRSRKAVIRCSPCQLADGMLHIMMKRRVPRNRLDVCETETPCPDLLEALEILEKCARRHWYNPDHVNCSETWSVEQCLVDRGLYSLQCRKLSQVIDIVLADYEHHKTICTTTTTTTTTTSTTTPPTTTPTTTTTEASTTTTRPTTPSTTTMSTTTVDYTALHNIIRTNCDADNDIMNRNLSDVIKATTDVTSDRATDRLLQTYLGICVKLQTFTDCLGELHYCRGLNQRHCHAAVPPQLGQMLERRAVAWCARAVREAAADMTLLQQRQEGEELPNNTMRGWNSETEFNCTYGEGSRLCVSIFWLCVGSVLASLLV